MKSTVLFIVNPISGFGEKNWIEKIIHQKLDVGKFDYSILYTEFGGHAKKLAAKAVKEQVDIIVAIGGDGTINEIAHELVNSDVKLGIIPLGSGNGLGRHVGIPLNPAKAIEIINKEMVETVDTCKINEFTFVNIAGLGFDALISKIFNAGNQRGYMAYIKCVIQNFRRYNPGLYRFKKDNTNFEKRLLTIAFANSQQYGNNAYVAPLASIKDGWMDVVLIRPFPGFYWPVIIYKTLVKRLHKSRYIESFRTKQFSLSAQHTFPIHLDGDYLGENTMVDVKIYPKSLKMLVGKRNI